ncbi:MULTISPECIES: hypothetical protein [Mesonia]|uniref:Uncharacterized protein n=1 Tax=Mesonia oceanica TaxID=2687242 RepID=A0AC61Y7B1_9FLAO|nr:MULTISPECIES: hypothetical protein [Mesonia]VVV00401.1 hypothetical protein FVB9532_01671 [Mesonia oceanica]|tara:strand:- start:1003 stop:1398 length:396 start_codon:yes stop_codon:yes gene_type:complete
MATKMTDFLFGCKNLYSLGIHPFDFSKSDSDEYKAIIELGKEIIQDIGLQSFAEFIIEYQYRVGIWSSFITLEFGKPDQNEILQISGTKTILSACLEKIEQNEINELPSDIIENKNNWITKIKTCYNTGYK